MRIRLAIVLCLFSSALAPPASAATLNVCASGCAYSGLQAAIDAAAAGDTILLRAGETFVGPFVLRAKPASSGWITIRSDAADPLLPGTGVRLVPSGKAGANTSRSLLPRLVGQGGTWKTTPVVRTAPGAHHYLLKFLEIDGSANLGYETLIAFGDDTTATTASDIVLDRVYAHGHATKGMKRGISLNSVRTDILNSYVSDVKAVNADSQAIAGYNGAGPFRIINNYLEGAGENVMFGGSDPAVLNLVPSNILIRQNLITKPLAWQNAILAPPGSPRAVSSTTTGSLASGAHYFKVVAVMTTGNVLALSAPSAEVSATQATSGKSIAVSWSGVTGADRYRIYHGRSAGGETLYMETSGAVTSFTYTGASEQSGTPGSNGTKWVVKNLLELKNAQHVTIDGNIIENVWASGQFGYAILLTPRNQNGGASWVRVRDVTITNNIVRHASGVLQLSGTDATHTSQQTQRVTLRNNLMYDINPQKWGGLAKVFLMGEGPAGVVIDRNTIVHTNSSVVYAYGTEDVTGFVYTNNISKHHTYGIMGEGGRPGQYTIDMFFPSSNITYNVLAGGPASSYPRPNAFPTTAQFDASFVNAAAGDYRLLTTSVFYGAGSGGSVPGADIGTLTAALAGNTPDPTPDPDPEPLPTPSAGTLVIHAGKAPARVGAWTTVADSTAASGRALILPDTGRAKVTTALANPGEYAELAVNVEAGKPYRLWVRGKATNNNYANDSVFVQFSGAVDAGGRALYRIGTTGAAELNIENCGGCGLNGWGWQDNGWGVGVAGPVVYFARSGTETLRIQNREDGLRIDQVMLSPDTYLTAAPGSLKSDTTLYAENVAGAPAPSSPSPTGPTPTSGTNTVPVAAPGGPYSGARGAAMTVDGSASSDADGSITTYRWSWGDEVVVQARDAAVSIVGTRWTRGTAPGAAGGVAVRNPDNGAAKVGTALTAPASYVEVRFYAAAGVPYHLWFRMRAEDDSYSNDSMFVQFGGAVTATGAAVHRVGTSSAASVIVEEGTGGGLSGWGWNDTSYGGLGAPVYFATSGLQTLRIQQREDGIEWDQLVVSAGRYFSTRPGLVRSDSTVVSADEGSGMVTSHQYPAAGVYPVRLTVTDDDGATATAGTTVTIR